MHQLRICDLREDRDLNQTQVAEMLNVHQTTYSDYELGRLNVPVSALHILAAYYGVSTDYLLGRTDVKAPYPKNDSSRKFAAAVNHFRRGVYVAKIH